MKEQYQKIILDIIKIKTSLIFIFIFAMAIIYSAEMLRESIYIKEIFFWIAILLMMMFQTFKPMTTLLDTIQKIVTRDNDAIKQKGVQNE